MTEECTALDGERLVPFRVGNLCKVRVGVRTTPMRRADMFDCAVNASVLTDVLEPSLLTVRKLAETTAENLVLREPGKFRIDHRETLEYFVVDLRFIGLLGAPLWCPAACFQQRSDLRPAVQIGAGKLLR